MPVDLDIEGVLVLVLVVVGIVDSGRETEQELHRLGFGTKEWLVVAIEEEQVG